MILKKSLTVAVLAFAVSACGGGGATPPSILPSTNGSPGTSVSTSKANASISITLPDSTAASQNHRVAAFVSPSTTIVHIALQDSVGHGNPKFSYKEQLDDQHCAASTDPNQPASRVCTFTISLPVGADTLSILATCDCGVPLSYANYGLTIAADGSYKLAQGPSSNALAGIIASATTAYFFKSISPEQPSALPVMTTNAYDAAGDLLNLHQGDPYPLNTTSHYTVTQSVGNFLPVIVAHGYAIFPQSSAVNSFTGAAIAATANLFLEEVGNGSTAPFTTTVTTTTPQVQYTQAEFPTLPAATATVSASASSITLTCQFLSATPTTDPCLGSVPVTLPVF